MKVQWGYYFYYLLSWELTFWVGADFPGTPTESRGISRFPGAELSQVSGWGQDQVRCTLSSDLDQAYWWMVGLGRGCLEHKEHWAWSNRDRHPHLLVLPAAMGLCCALHSLPCFCERHLQGNSHPCTPFQLLLQWQSAGGNSINEFAAYMHAHVCFVHASATEIQENNIFQSKKVTRYQMMNLLNDEWRSSHLLSPCEVASAFWVIDLALCRYMSAVNCTTKSAARFMLSWWGWTPLTWR